MFIFILAEDGRNICYPTNDLDKYKEYLSYDNFVMMRKITDIEEEVLMRSIGANYNCNFIRQTFTERHHPYISEIRLDALLGKGEVKL
jgi:hypothetical protein